jgi:4-amino-4-deoxy-L-arabinose transferase-like glycosyltransferase
MADDTRESHPSCASPWYAGAALIVVLCWFCGPLFIGLGEWDLQSDEAIYSHAIDKMLETGDWLTPRTIRFDEPFLEKPPLKLWIVAGAIRAGLLPQDEYGFRFFDALFGAVAFVYVFWLGRWLAGSICGIVAVLVLFTLDALLFDHGLRSNNMDAALVLAYCGGVFHFARWVEHSSRNRRSLHATAAALYFVLGFMTKYVAVLFLPIVCALSLFWHRDARARTRSYWREWTTPALLAVAVIMPWFVYQVAQAGGGLWETMWRDQVFARFTGVMDARRLLPWHFYFSWLAGETISAGSHWMSMLGLLVLGVKAWQGRPWLARVLLLWFILPFGLLSIGTSKFLHYTYPFLPPLALGAGAAAAMLVAAIERMIDRAASATGRRLRVPRIKPITRMTWAQRLLVAVGLFAVALALWTAMAGRVRLEVGQVELLQNSSVFRPLMIAAILFAISGHAWIVSHAVAIAAVAIILPVSAYALTVNRFSDVDHPLRAARDCALMMRTSRPETRVFLHYYQLLNHSPYYYLSRVGPWDEQGTGLTNDELDRRLYAPGQQTFTIVSRSDYDRFAQVIAARELPIPPGLAHQVDIVLLTPGPFEPCGRAAVAAGGEGVGALAPPAVYGR